MRKSLGLLEVKGLASAILVADTMAKTAPVTIVGIETCKGGGWQTIKVLGDVAAVQSSLSSGSELARQTNSFIAMKIISRPDQIIFKTWGKTPNKVTANTPFVKNKNDAEPKEAKPSLEAATKEKQNQDTSQQAQITCNLCGDPLCPREKGEPHINCIHDTRVR